MDRILIIGYGNPDRQDDGVAWHVICNLASYFNRQIPDSYSEGIFPANDNPDFYFLLQLTPEISEMMENYDSVIFIDAHTENIPDDLQIIEIEPQFQQSPLTHHLTPATCLLLAQTIHGFAPKGTLVSIKGHQFGFSQKLSKKTEALVKIASKKIIEILPMNPE